MKKEIRYRVELVKMNLWQRLVDWWNGVRDAILEKPETHYSKWIVVNPGDVGCEDAPFGRVTDPYPLRYKFENGQFVKVDMTEVNSEPNQDWHNE